MDSLTDDKKKYFVTRDWSQSNEYPQCMFLWKNKEISSMFHLKKKRTFSRAMLDTKKKKKKKFCRMMVLRNPVPLVIMVWSQDQFRNCYLIRLVMN